MRIVFSDKTVEAVFKKALPFFPVALSFGYPVIVCYYV